LQDEAKQIASQQLNLEDVDVMYDKTVQV